MSEEQWVPLLGYPGYSVSNMGRVRNDNRDKILARIQNQFGYSYVGLSLDKIQVKRSISRLVAESFLPPPPQKTFTTPIHFDGDLTNCCAANMDWRPRWFALKHVAQFKRGFVSSPNEVINLSTEELFKNCWAAVLHYGLLYLDLIRSIVRETPVFPTMHKYEWRR
jgi:hypothetical protein